MRVYDSISSFHTPHGTVVTLGTFDGVHAGHRSIIAGLSEAAKAEGCESLLLTFFPHPRMVIKHDTPIRMLNTLDEKIRLLDLFGLDNLVIHPFDAEFSQLSAEEFVRNVLVATFRTKKIIVGHDHRFGKNRQAGFEDLVRFGEKYGFKVEQIPAEAIDDIAVSSTKIRKALDSGDVATANSFLGYDYMLGGTVIRGNQIGRTIGYPTANIGLDDPQKLIPAIGVYAGYSIIDGKRVNGMINIGTRPTIGGQDLSVEIHYFDFNQDLYDSFVEIRFVSRLRSEVKFGSLDELKQQLATDEAAARKILEP